MDMDAYIRNLLVTNPLREPTLRAATEALDLPPDSRGLDAGCGVGLQSLLLAEAVWPAGHVTALDTSPELIERGRQIVGQSEQSELISFEQGDASALPFEDDAFDWAWSADCVGYAPVEPVPLLAELARVVQPGGTVALIAWTSERILPGHPRLEARLGATAPGLAPFVHGQEPERHFMRALGWFRELGLEERRARVFVGDAHAPLDEDVRKALVALFEMRWPGAESELEEEDREEFERLCRPGSPGFIVDHPDYHAFFTCSMFWGTVGGGQ
ncbi:MAG: class I SAM-dependent methyltransferase [Deltaproteobacteria bacterium]|nr:class I SAM-dependent methyltransferase [Deltaproteobacteria bacterium]